MPVQTILVPAQWGIDRAVRWLDKHHYVHYKVDYAGNYMRFRQQEPIKGSRYATEVLSNGVHIVYFIPPRIDY